MRLPPETDMTVVAPTLRVTVVSAEPMKIPPMSMLVPTAIPAPVVQVESCIALEFLPIYQFSQKARTPAILPVLGPPRLKIQPVTFETTLELRATHLAPPVALLSLRDKK